MQWSPENFGCSRYANMSMLFRGLILYEYDVCASTGSVRSKAVSSLDVLK